MQKNGTQGRGSVLVCHREGVEEKRWPWGGRERGNLNTWKAVGKVKLEIAALKKVSSALTCQCSEI